jgi:hypothetical protein
MLRGHFTEVFVDEMEEESELREVVEGYLPRYSFYLLYWYTGTDVQTLTSLLCPAPARGAPLRSSMLLTWSSFISRPERWPSVVTSSMAQTIR